MLKQANFVWKRMRKSLKKNRNEDLFRFFQKELELLKNQAIEKEIDLCYFDATGLNLNPNVPYAWQKKGETKSLPADRAKGRTILGVLNYASNEFMGNIYEGSANSDCVIQTLNKFSKTLKRKTILVLDNASIHKSKMVMDCVDQWKAKGLFLQFIPAYCPELNLIEILWKKLKYYWLKTEHYSSINTLENAAISILQKYGKDYTVSFA